MKQLKIETDEDAARRACAHSWAVNADIRAEFRDVECYWAYLKAATAGLVRVVRGRGKPLTPADMDGIAPSLPIEKTARAAWDSSADLRAEFLYDFRCYLAFRRGVESGRVGIVNNSAAVGDDGRI